MTDRIDLDELAGTDEEEPETGNRGDWLWRGDEAGDEEAPAPEEASATAAAGSASRLAAR